MNVFVIIVTYNGMQWYDRCFESLRLSLIPIQTIVVDNASSDASVSYIENNFPEIIVFKSDKNIGFGQANNKAISYALDNEANYVFLLNQDAWIEPNTIEGLIEIHKQNSVFGILSPMHLNTDKNRIEFFLMKCIGNYHITSSDLIDDLYFDRLKDVYETKYVNAAAWLLPSKTIEMIGGFDPIFFHYGEDDNYMQRVSYHGLKIGLCPNLKIVHDTERQVIRDISAQKSFLKILLVEATNINEKFEISKRIFFYLRKIFLKTLRFNFTQVRYYYSLLKFIYLNKNKIKKSREENIKEARTWLY